MSEGNTWMLVSKSKECYIYANYLDSGFRKDITMHGANIHSHKYELAWSYIIVPRHLIATYYYNDVQQVFGILQ